ncbi:terminase small subunit [Rhodanobacter sp. UC4437_H4]
MTKFTEKQQAFIDNKAAGVTNREAATAAGYSMASADVRAAELMRRPEIKAAIKAAAKPGSVTITPDKHAMPKKHYADSLQFMVDTMNHPQLPVAMRFEAAKALLPYQHARLGEQGKKESAKERARSAINGRRGKFTPKAAPPQLRIVD